MRRSREDKNGAGLRKRRALTAAVLLPPSGHLGSGMAEPGLVISTVPAEAVGEAISPSCCCNPGVFPGG